MHAVLDTLRYLIVAILHGDNIFKLCQYTHTTTGLIHVCTPIFIDAYILSEWFQIHEVSRAGSEETFDSWCKLVTLKKTGILSTKAPADIFLPKNVLFGEKASCFYCGMRNHAAADLERISKRRC